MEGSPTKDGYLPQLPSVSGPSTQISKAQVDFLQKRCAHLHAQLAAQAELHIETQDELGKLKEANQQLSVELTQLQNAYQAAIKVQTHFLDNMSHELRTPLNGILGMAQLMQTLPLKNEIRDYTNAILDSGRQLEEILSNLLDYTNLSEGNVRIHEAPFDLLSSVESLVSQIAPNALKKGVDISLGASETAHCSIESDQMRILKILKILLENAIAYTEKGAVAASLTIDRASSPIKLLAAVEDSGSGIEQADLAHIFEPFWQADGSNTRAHGGLGIGLTLCKKLIDLLGGAITVDSRIGSGTKVHVEIPLTHAAPPVLQSKQGFSDLKIGLLNLESTTATTLASYLAWWHIKPLFAAHTHVISEEAFEQDLLIISADPRKNEHLFDLIKDDRKRAHLPLLLGVVNPEMPPTSYEKTAFDVLVEMPVFHEDLRASLAFAHNLWEKTSLTASSAISSNRATRILLLESNKTNQKILAHMLKTLGLESVFIEWEALGQIIKEDVTYGALLFNISEPLPDRFEALLEQTRLSSLQHPANVIGISDRSFAEPAKILAKASVSKYLTLPTSIDAFKEILFSE